MTSDDLHSPIPLAHGYEKLGKDKDTSDKRITLQGKSETTTAPIRHPECSCRPRSVSSAQNVLQRLTGRDMRVPIWTGDCVGQSGLGDPTESTRVVPSKHVCSGVDKFRDVETSLWETADFELQFDSTFGRTARWTV